MPVSTERGVNPLKADAMCADCGSSRAHWAAWKDQTCHQAGRRKSCAGPGRRTVCQWSSRSNARSRRPIEFGPAIARASSAALTGLNRIAAENGIPFRFVASRRWP